MFGRATITLGIGPHSSFVMFFLTFLTFERFIYLYISVLLFTFTRGCRVSCEVLALVAREFTLVLVASVAVRRAVKRADDDVSVTSSRRRMSGSRDYELSPDLREKQVEMLCRKYGGVVATPQPPRGACARSCG